jgi:ubiquinone/menaquinone biosynthesis C-methylase UbiE
MLSDNFYEEYGIQWATPLRASHEELCSKKKVEDWTELIPRGVEINSFIDFGCGNGVFLDSFARTRKIGGIGIDISESMILAAREKFPKASFVVGTIETPGVQELSADVVFFNDVLEHLQKPVEHLVWARSISKFVGITIPLEKTWLIALLNSLHLKQPISRLYHSEGHLYEFSRSDVHKLLEEAGLKLLAEKTVNDSREIVFHPYICESMKAKRGVTGLLRRGFYRLAEKLPYRITSSLLRPLKGATLVAFCKS